MEERQDIWCVISTFSYYSALPGRENQGKATQIEAEAAREQPFSPERKNRENRGTEMPREAGDLLRATVLSRRKQRIRADRKNSKLTLRLESRDSKH